ncbi:MAG: cob(I)yrinic acid a,c-diamide adenosyltransferase [Chloroflexi bacterium]|nr:cob(I)yrinic acid a,c-diamide adenosyltransferase [Chloroflexota bacterium]
MSPSPASGDGAPIAGGPGSTPEAEAYRRSVRNAKRRKGLVIVNTGTGKGKTTAAFGIAFRARGRGMRVGVLQFIKPGTARFGELRAARDAGIHVEGAGDGWTWKSRDLDASATQALAGWEHAQRYMLDAAFDVLVLDEFTYPLHYGWIDTAECLAWLAQHKPHEMHLVITGRHAPEALIDFADLVTEMRLVKHPFREQGIRAQPGIEF